MFYVRKFSIRTFCIVDLPDSEEGYELELDELELSASES